MRNVSDAFKAAIRGNGREIDACGYIRNGEEVYFLGMNDILSLSRCFDMGSDITLGGVYASYWKMSFKNYDGLFDNIDLVGACANFYVGIKINSGWEYIPSGNLYITKMSEPAKSVEIEAYDETVLLNADMGGIVSPYTLSMFASTAASKAGLSLYEPYFTNSSLKFASSVDCTGVTVRQVLSWCAQIAGGFIRIMKCRPGAGTPKAASWKRLVRKSNAQQSLFFAGFRFLCKSFLCPKNGRGKHEKEVKIVRTIYGISDRIYAQKFYIWH